MIFDRQVCQETGAHYIVLDAHTRVLLHHRYMLIRCSMKNIGRTMLIEYGLHAISVCNGRNNEHYIKIIPFFTYFQHQVMHRRFSLINQYQLGRIVCSNLADHFTSNTSCCTSYHNNLTTEQIPNLLHIDLYFSPR